MKALDIVKYAAPAQGEEDLRFEVREVNGDRALIALVCDWTIPPVECVKVDDLALAFTIKLHHCPRFETGGYDCGAPACKRKQQIPVGNLKEASEVMRKWITDSELGGSNLDRDCGKVMDGNSLVAKVSYNGRVWGVDGQEIAI